MSRHNLLDSLKKCSLLICEMLRKEKKCVPGSYKLTVIYKLVLISKTEKKFRGPVSAVIIISSCI